MNTPKGSKQRKLRNIIIDGPFQSKIVLISVSVVILQAVITTGYFIVTGTKFINETLPTLTSPAEITASLQTVYIQLLIAFSVANIDCLIVAIVLSLYFSHKAAGPNYAIKRAITNLLDGVEHHTINLRKGDEFHDLAERINALFTDMKERCISCKDDSTKEPKTSDIK